VQLVQEGDEIPAGISFAQWMPYQVGQAKKHDAEPRGEARRAARPCRQLDLAKPAREARRDLRRFGRAGADRLMCWCTPGIRTPDCGRFNCRPTRDHMNSLQATEAASAAVAVASAREARRH
jgi:hypothetical protein